MSDIIIAVMGVLGGLLIAIISITSKNKKQEYREQVRENPNDDIRITEKKEQEKIDERIKKKSDSDVVREFMDKFSRPPGSGKWDGDRGSSD